MSLARLRERPTREVADIALLWAIAKRQGGSSGPSSVVGVAYATGAGVIVPTAPIFAVGTDTILGGAFALTIPTLSAGQAGYIWGVEDVHQPGGSWGTNAQSLIVPAGIYLENPAAPGGGGTYVTATTIALPQANGGSYSWRWYPLLGLHKLCD
jgi:hypothetical protein